MRNFLWNGAYGEGGDHLVSWNNISRPKEKGGLGIGNLRSKNKALLFKWLWRFPKERETLWAKIIKSKFGLHSNRWDSKMARRSTFRSSWNYILVIWGVLATGAFQSGQ